LTPKVSGYPGKSSRTVNSDLPPASVTPTRISGPNRRAFHHEPAPRGLNGLLMRCNAIPRHGPLVVHVLPGCPPEHGKNTAASLLPTLHSVASSSTGSRSMWSAQGFTRHGAPLLGSSVGAQKLEDRGGSYRLGRLSLSSRNSASVRGSGSSPFVAAPLHAPHSIIA
jgi:hypothetical protein